MRKLWTILLFLAACYLMLIAMGFILGDQRVIDSVTKHSWVRIMYGLILLSCGWDAIPWKKIT